MKILLTTITALFFSIQITIAQTEAQIKAIELYNVAVEALGNGDNPQAIAALSKAIELDGRFHKAIYQRGLTYIQEGQYLPSIQDLSNYLKLKPEDGNAHYYRGYAEMQSKLNEKAIISYTKAIEQDDSLEKAFYYRGYLFILADDYSKAIDDIDLALANGYKSDNLWKNKALCHYKLQEYDASVMAYDKYLENNPDDTKSAYTKSVALYKSENYQEFIPGIKNYLKRNNGSRDQYYMLATAYLKTQNYGEALTAYDQVLEIDPVYMPALKNCLYISSKQENEDRMIMDYTRLIEVEGPQSEYLYKRGVLLMKKELWTEALIDINGHLSNQTDHAEAYFNRASIYSTQKKYAEACEDMRQAAKLGMESAFQYIPSLCKAADN